MARAFKLIDGHNTPLLHRRRRDEQRRFIFRSEMMMMIRHKLEA
jgi:hypothetical protein